jgi:tetraacyldisaccharide 4'-kinase
VRAPAFWSRGGVLPALLAPAAGLWTAVTRSRLRRGVWARVGVPVICVGNLTVGGTGKTPAVIAVVERLASRGVAVAAVSRGYGGRLEGPVRVDAARHGAGDVGDEPLLLAAFAAVWVGRDRAAAARAAAAEGAEVVVLDDGFQNPGLAKDLSVVVVDAAQGFGNGRVVPAGPLREPVADGLARADLVLALGEAGAVQRFIQQWQTVAAVPVMTGRVVPLATGMPWAGLRVVAFAGIGRPEKLFDTLRGLGAEVVASHGFADHAAYSDRVLARLEREAAGLGAQLVTTEKDAVRLPAGFRRRVLVLPVRLEVDDWAPFDERVAALGLG